MKQLMNERELKECVGGPTAMQYNVFLTSLFALPVVGNLISNAITNLGTSDPSLVNAIIIATNNLPAI
jgi:hypothetical protein